MRHPDFYQYGGGTKDEMIAIVYSILSKFYGQTMTPTPKAKRMVKLKWRIVYQSAYYNRRGPLTEQVKLIEAHLNFQSSF